MFVLSTEKNEVETKVTNAQRTTLLGLHKYTNYSIFVLAFTQSGDGVRSAPTFCRSEEDGECASMEVHESRSRRRHYRDANEGERQSSSLYV